MELRGYQARCLEELSAYLDVAARHGAKHAFLAQTERPYRSVPRLPELPYVCLRVPTGGGKTLMAAHVVGLVAHRFVQREPAVCLWLVPSNAIRGQTLLRLRRAGDAYREALASNFGGRISVLDLTEALHVQRSSLDNETVVIVSTLAALRVEDTEGRMVYQASGALEHHFTALPQELVAQLECRDGGSPIESLANVLRLRRPSIIMDEAHNARTRLTFDALTRFDPSAIIEFTATPETTHAPEHGQFASNVLTHVSAAELKVEEMVKLPIKLLTRPAWPEAVADAVAKQQELERVAAREAELTGERIRPIVLLQAQPRRQGTETVTPEVLRRALIEDHRIPEDQVAVATGERRELDGVDLNDPATPIRYVITVQALREGWDCPTAYVLCSVAEQGSATAVEQILGRILRLPNAKRKRLEALNCSYAFVVSQRFLDAAAGLRDALIDNGFERFEAESVVEEAHQQPTFFGATPQAPVRGRVSQPPARPLPASLASIVRYDPATQSIIIAAPLSDAQEDGLAESFASPLARAEVRQAARESREGPSERRPHRVAEPLLMPQLAIRRGRSLELFDETHLLEAEWRLSTLEADLSEQEFSMQVAAGAAGEVDVNAQGAVQITPVDQIRFQLALLEGEGGWTLVSLVRWLDTHIPHADLTQEDVQLFLHKAITALLRRPNVTLERLARDKHRVLRALEEKINGHRRAQRKQVYQAWLMGRGPGEVVTDDALVLEIGDEHRYAPNWLYAGAYRFQKPLFQSIGELESDGEEFECAVQLDAHDLVQHWLRNLSRRQASFALQTSTDRFYPDFVGRLRDGRVFAVEYKRERDWSNEDSEEKRAIGELWAARCNGRAVFLMLKGPDWAAIDTAFRGETG